MTKTCCICKKARENAMLHSFPENRKRQLKWLNCLKRVVGLDFNSLKSKVLINQYVCHEHFEKRFCTKSKSRLSVKAYPSLFTKDEISTGISVQEDFEIADLIAEHNYSQKYTFDHTYYRSDSPNESSRLLEPISPDITVDTTDLNEISTCDDPSELSIDKNNEIESSSLPETILPGQNQNVIVSKDILNYYGNCCVDENCCKHQLTCKKHLNQQTVSVSNLSKTGDYKVYNPLKKRRFSPRSSPIELYKELQKVRKRLRSTLRANEALKITEREAFNRMTQKMNSLTRRILWRQIKNSSIKQRKRRFFDEEKLIAVTIWRLSPRCYKFLQNIFILPSKRTVQKVFSHIDNEIKTNPKFIETLNADPTDCDNDTSMQQE